MIFISYGIQKRFLLIDAALYPWTEILCPAVKIKTNLKIPLFYGFLCPFLIPTEEWFIKNICFLSLFTDYVFFLEK